MTGDAPAHGMTDHAHGVVEVVGPDIEASLAFYTALGFELARRSGNFAIVHRDGLRLFLAEDVHATTQPRWTNLRVMTNDIDALHEQARARGVAILHAPQDRPFGLREFVVRDPNGLDLRFCQPVEPMP
ncbi:VOC family protein [Lysobacter arvi]|uniref:VOC family protein n=1 Tax=Lysobacter arvi TaxID=3038776 RepID=A0ABU1CAW8_9GAMM|nr:VOC family protein [Lysobacter arvi]MDR0182288.1 VOC family protein [Lysobacter arvi]